MTQTDDEDLIKLDSAKTAAIRALLKMVQMKYTEAAELYDAAADRVPEGYPIIASNYRESAEDARKLALENTYDRG